MSILYDCILLLFIRFQLNCCPGWICSMLNIWKLFVKAWCIDDTFDMPSSEIRFEGIFLFVIFSVHDLSSSLYDLLMLFTPYLCAFIYLVWCWQFSRSWLLRKLALLSYFAINIKCPYLVMCCIIAHFLSLNVKS